MARRAKAFGCAATILSGIDSMMSAWPLKARFAKTDGRATNNQIEFLEINQNLSSTVYHQ